MKPFLALIALFLLPAAHAQERRGTVLDSATNAPVAGAVVTIGNQTVLTDAQGQYRMAGGTLPLRIRAPSTPGTCTSSSLRGTRRAPATRSSTSSPQMASAQASITTPCTSTSTTESASGSRNASFPSRRTSQEGR